MIRRIDDVPDVNNGRQHPRQTLPAPYTAVRIRRAGKQRFSLTGHAYDISISGMRFELDEPLESGELVEIEVKFPRKTNKPPLVTTGRVVRYHDPDEVGPIRMGMAFTQLEESMEAELETV